MYGGGGPSLVFRPIDEYEKIPHFLLIERSCVSVLFIVQYFHEIDADKKVFFLIFQQIITSSTMRVFLLLQLSVVLGLLSTVITIKMLYMYSLLIFLI